MKWRSSTKKGHSLIIISLNKIRKNNNLLISHQNFYFKLCLNLLKGFIQLKKEKEN